MTTPAVLLSEAEVARRVEALAGSIAPRIDDDTVAVCLLTGGLWFCGDLMRARFPAVTWEPGGGQLGSGS